jgi:alpha-beta hydrolase superfamily lysophospholipase
MAESRAHPFHFGDLPGWLHLPDGPARGPAIVLCNAAGGEMICAYAGWRTLAVMLADAGMPVLRFDYDGTGNAPGDDRLPDRLGAWSHSITKAIDEMKRLCGVSAVVLVGLRLGATLALRAARGRTDIAGFVLLAPIRSGKAHARELSALARMNRRRADDAEPDDDEIGGIGVNGFFFSDETLNALKAVTFADDAAGIACPCLIMDRDQGTLDALSTGLGPSVTKAVFAGYDRFMVSPTASRPPQADWAIIRDWCSGLPSAPRPVALAPPIDGAQSIVGDGWSEEPHMFGKDQRLHGRMTWPARQPAGDVCVVLPNAGRNCHMGWGRGSVEMARALARAGIPVFRFDTAAIGDSPAWPDGPAEVLYDPSQQADLKAALDHLAAHDFKRFCMAGSCSGAFLSLRCALTDARIGSLMLTNILRFHWTLGDNLEVAEAQSYKPTDAYRALLTSGDTWRRLFAGKIDVMGIGATLVRRAARGGVALMRNTLARTGLIDTPEREAMRWMQALSARGVDTQFTYSVDDPGLAELQHYFGSNGQALTRSGLARISMIPNADHNLSERRARIAVLRLVQAQASCLQSGPSTAAAGSLPAS